MENSIVGVPLLCDVCSVTSHGRRHTSTRHRRHQQREEKTLRLLDNLTVDRPVTTYRAIELNIDQRRKITEVVEIFARARNKLKSYREIIHRLCQQKGLELPELFNSGNLEGNRLTVPSLDFRDCRLRKLLLGLNALEYLPTLAPLTQLVELSVYSLRICALAPRGDPLRVFEAAAVRAFVLRPTRTPSTSTSRDNPATGYPRKPNIPLLPPSNWKQLSCAGYGVDWPTD